MCLSVLNYLRLEARVCDSLCLYMMIFCVTDSMSPKINFWLGIFAVSMHL